MNSETPHSGPAGPKPPTSQRQPLSWGVLLVRIVLPLLILATGVAAGYLLLQSGPQARPQPLPRTAALVEVEPVSFQQQTASIEGMGTVRPARQVELKPRVAGEILELGPGLVPGGIVRQGQALVRIDPADYELALRQARSEVARAEADVAAEQGNQMVALQEYELLGEQVSEEELALMLRKPQLESLQAALEAARTRVDQAQLALKRTQVVAPFDAVVISRDANVGSRVNESTPLATLVGIDEYWVEALIPVNQLKWIRIPSADKDAGSMAKVFDRVAWGPEEYRTGRVIQLAAGLEEQGRMARLLIRVDDPLGLAESPPAPRLLLESYVRIEIEGEPLPPSVAVERAYFRGHDRVWIMTDDFRLDIRPVEIAYRGREHIFVTGGLQPDDRLIVSDIPSPVPGMALRLRQQDSSPAADDQPAAAADREGRADR